MRVLEAFETSDKLTTEGRPCEIEFGGKVICIVQIRPADAYLNADYRRVAAELAQGIERKNGEMELDEREDRAKLYRLYARAVITGWKWTDPKDKRDKSLAFTEENAVALFTRAPKFFEAIQTAARRWSNFRAEFDEDAAKN